MTEHAGPRRRDTDKGPFGRSDELGTAGSHAVGQPPVGDQLPRIAGSAHGDTLAGAAAIEDEATGRPVPAPPGLSSRHGGGAQVPAAPLREPTSEPEEGGGPKLTAGSEPAEGRRNAGGSATDREHAGEPGKRVFGPRP